MIGLPEYFDPSDEDRPKRQIKATPPKSFRFVHLAVMVFRSGDSFRYFFLPSPEEDEEPDADLMVQKRVEYSDPFDLIQIELFGYCKCFGGVRDNVTYVFDRLRILSRPDTAGSTEFCDTFVDPGSYQFFCLWADERGFIDHEKGSASWYVTDRGKQLIDFYNFFCMDIIREEEAANQPDDAE